MMWIDEHQDPPSFRVNRRAFVSAEILEAEQRQIFDRTWLYVGHASEVPDAGNFVTRDVGGRPMIMNRGRDGALRVFFNTCRHRGAEVCRNARGTARYFTCFYHAWTYDDAGRLVSLPGEDTYPDGFDKSGMGLVSPAQVDEYRGFIFCCFDAGADDLRTYLAGTLDYFDLVVDASPGGLVLVGGSHTYAIGANWKLLVENGYDGYHLMSTHRTYLDFVRTQGVDTRAVAQGFEGAAGIDLGNGHGVTVRRQTMSPRIVARWTDALPDALRPRIEARRDELTERLGEERAWRVAELNFNLLVFPNLNIIGGVTPVVRTLYPSAIDRVDVTAWCGAFPDDEDLERKVRIEQYLTFWGPAGWATPDDVAALESCQRAYASAREVPWSDISKGLTREVPDNRDEHQMRAFWRRWLELTSGTEART